MSPIIRKSGEEFNIPSKYLLAVLSALCLVLMVVTFSLDRSHLGPFEKPLNAFAGVFISPLQRGITSVGTSIKNTTDRLSEITKLLDENERLKKDIEKLTIENSRLEQDKYELNQLRELYSLEDDYGNYKKTGARVISGSTTNWYSTFTINKGEDDGLAVDMNVMANGGLVGRITKVGPDWATVLSIISDNSSVSGMVLSTHDNMMVTGNLDKYASGAISFSRLTDITDSVKQGDKVVTSNISEKYQPGILIGYISDVEIDSNKITKSGNITPAVDFAHINDVVVILDQKRNPEEEEDSSKEEVESSSEASLESSSDASSQESSKTVTEVESEEGTSSNN